MRFRLEARREIIGQTEAEKRHTPLLLFNNDGAKPIRPSPKTTRLIVCSNRLRPSASNVSNPIWPRWKTRVSPGELIPSARQNEDSRAPEERRSEERRGGQECDSTCRSRW